MMNDSNQWSFSMMPAMVVVGRIYKEGRELLAAETSRLTIRKHPYNCPTLL
jgi:hypothetical protein